MKAKEYMPPEESPSLVERVRATIERELDRHGIDKNNFESFFAGKIEFKAWVYSILSYHSHFARMAWERKMQQLPFNPAIHAKPAYPLSYTNEHIIRTREMMRMFEAPDDHIFITPPDDDSWDDRDYQPPFTFDRPHIVDQTLTIEPDNPEEDDLPDLLDLSDKASQYLDNYLLGTPGFSMDGFLDQVYADEGLDDNGVLDYDTPDDNDVEDSFPPKDDPKEKFLRDTYPFYKLNEEMFASNPVFVVNETGLDGTGTPVPASTLSAGEINRIMLISPETGDYMGARVWYWKIEGFENGTPYSRYYILSQGKSYQYTTELLKRPGILAQDHHNRMEQAIQIQARQAFEYIRSKCLAMLESQVPEFEKDRSRLRWDALMQATSPDHVLYVYRVGEPMPPVIETRPTEISGIYELTVVEAAELSVNQRERTCSLYMIFDHESGDVLFSEDFDTPNWLPYHQLNFNRYYAVIEYLERSYRDSAADDSPYKEGNIPLREWVPSALLYNEQAPYESSADWIPRYFVTTEDHLKEEAQGRTSIVTAGRNLPYDPLDTIYINPKDPQRDTYWNN